MPSKRPVKNLQICQVDCKVFARRLQQHFLRKGAERGASTLQSLWRGASEVWRVDFTDHSQEGPSLPARESSSGRSGFSLTSVTYLWQIAIVIPWIALYALIYRTRRVHLRRFFNNEIPKAAKLKRILTTNIVELPNSCKAFRTKEDWRWILNGWRNMHKVFLLWVRPPWPTPIPSIVWPCPQFPRSLIFD